jgi:hypothetical protein
MFRNTTNKIRHSYLAFGADTRKVEEDGRVSWTHPLNTRDGWALPNGNYLLTITRQNGWPSGGVLEVDPKGNKVVWEHKGTQSEVNTSQRCANGNTLLVEAGANPRLLEVSPSGKVEVEIALKAQTRDHHMQSRMSRKLANGNYLVPYLFDTCVREFAPEGRIVWEAKTPNWAFSALRMKNGHTLVSCTYGNIDVEFDKSGKKVWQVTNDDLAGAPFKDCCGAQLLPNGNIVQTAYGASGIAVKLVEFNKNKEVSEDGEEGEKDKAGKVRKGSSKPPRARSLSAGQEEAEGGEEADVEAPPAVGGDDDEDGLAGVHLLGELCPGCSEADDVGE